jgi:hypothetical protein
MLAGFGADEVGAKVTIGAKPAVLVLLALVAARSSWRRAVQLASATLDATLAPRPLPRAASATFPREPLRP